MAERLLQNSSAVLWTMQPVTSETRVRSQASLCDTFGGQVGLEYDLSEYLGIALSLLFHQCFILFIYTLLVPEGQTGKAWAPCKTNNAISERGDHSIGKEYDSEILTYSYYSYFHLFLMSTE